MCTQSWDPKPTRTRSRSVRVHGSNLLSHITTNALLDKALAHVSHRRRSDGPNRSICSLRHAWPQERERIRKALLSGKYLLEPLQVVGHREGHRLTRRFAWGLSDIVAAAVPECCTHLAGRGGQRGKGKGGVRALQRALSRGRTPWVLKSDVADYYASHNHSVVMEQWRAIVKDARILDILYQVVDRMEVRCGAYTQVTRGITKGCPLSPLMGALMLKSLDVQVPPGCVVIRYMDDWVILTRSRAQLRRMVQKMYRVLDSLGMRIAVAKTFIGRVAHGFDFLGYRFNAHGLVGCAEQTVHRFKERCLRLYEQGADVVRLQAYVRRWWQWVTGGLVSASG